jgi:pyridoxal phosphate enzyme (YggS family)
MSAQVTAECYACGRERTGVHLIAVSKTVGPDQVDLAWRAGASNFAENRPDELCKKQPLFPEANWHFIGNIQSRRIPDIVAHADLIHSVCNLEHAAKISEAAMKLGKVQDILLEVNVSGEESKSGFEPADVPDSLARCVAMPGLCVRGLMTMAPQGDLAVARQTFRGLRQIFEASRDSLRPEAAQYFCELSMGMSEDWREAIAEGATLVRIGRAVFSDSFDEQ